MAESAAASEEATEAVGEAEASDAQLVIAGGDSAGLIAAVQAAAEGMDPSKILILAPGEELAADMAEMAPYVNAANTDEQFQANLTDDFEIYLSDIMTAGNNTNNSDMAADVSENSEEAKDWLADTLGMEYGDLTQEAGSTVARSFPAKEGNLNELAQEALLKKVEELKIPVEYKTELKSVAYDEEGALDRITVTVDGKDQEIDCLALVATDVSLIPVFEESQVYGDCRERAVLVAVIRDNQDPRQTEEFLDELEFLAETADICSVKRFTQRLPQPSSRIYVGPGKLEEIAAYCREHEIDVVIFDDELTPSQTRNIEKEMPCRLLDRTRLILDIFMSRARTAYAKTQVQLANYEYMLPRLSGLWTHLERQRGGTGTRGGAGEREIETDRRIIRNRIAKLKEDLKKIDRQMAVQRSNRGAMVRVALVGYTNVGKSTLMNLISKSEVFAENKLFATLDTTVRKVVFDNLPFLLSDTVGFIRKLPTELIESFKSTLDEVREADLLVHVVDISHPQFEEQIAVVKQTLQEIGAGDKPVYLVFNKVDAYTYIEKEEDDLTPATRENLSLEELKKSWIARANTPCIFLSALAKTNLEKFRSDLYGMVREIHAGRYPFNNFLY